MAGTYLSSVTHLSLFQGLDDSSSLCRLDRDVSMGARDSSELRQNI